MCERCIRAIVLTVVKWAISSLCQNGYPVNLGDGHHCLSFPPHTLHPLNTNTHKQDSVCTQYYSLSEGVFTMCTYFQINLFTKFPVFLHLSYRFFNYIQLISTWSHLRTKKVQDLTTQSLRAQGDL